MLGTLVSTLGNTSWVAYIVNLSVRSDGSGHGSLVSWPGVGRRAWHHYHRVSGPSQRTTHVGHDWRPGNSVSRLCHARLASAEIVVSHPWSLRRGLGIHHSGPLTRAIGGPVSGSNGPPRCQWHRTTVSIRDVSRLGVLC